MKQGAEGLFWAITDSEGGVVSVTHDKYGEMKAVFFERKLAEECLGMNNSKEFQIQPIHIIDAL